MKDGGPAFPRIGYETPSDGWRSGEVGMSLRDYFAAAAMQGIIISGGSSVDLKDRTVEKAAFAIADAMLEERDK